MARSSGTIHLNERLSGPDRLRAMQLPADRPGWTPEPLATSGARTGHVSDQGASVEPADLAGARSALPESVDAPSVDPPRPAAGPSLAELAGAWVTDRLPLWSHALVERIGLGVVGVALAALALVAVLGVKVLHHSAAAGSATPYDVSATAGGGSSAAGAGSSGSSSSDASPSATSDSASAADGASIVVDVGGRVRHPGLVTLPAGARVADALKAAGGPLHHREIATLDLAARVGDGQLLLIGEPTAPDGTAAAEGAAGASDGSSGAPSAPVDLDSATLEELETLPNVGPVTAQKIVDWRTAHNGFTSVAQLQQVPGIGPVTFAQLSPLVTP